MIFFINPKTGYVPGFLKLFLCGCPLHVYHTTSYSLGWTHTHARTHTHIHTHKHTHTNTYTHKAHPVLSCLHTAHYGHVVPLSRRKQKLVIVTVDYTFIDVQLGPQHSSINADNVGIEQLHSHTAHKLVWLSHLSIYVTLNHPIY